MTGCLGIQRPGADVAPRRALFQAGVSPGELPEEAAGASAGASRGRCGRAGRGMGVPPWWSGVCAAHPHPSSPSSRQPSPLPEPPHGGLGSPRGARGQERTRQLGQINTYENRPAPGETGAGAGGGRRGPCKWEPARGDQSPGRPAASRRPPAPAAASLSKAHKQRTVRLGGPALNLPVFKFL